MNILVIDDRRMFDRATEPVARTSEEGLHLLERFRGKRVDELWLDHDLGGKDTIKPIVNMLEEDAFNGRPWNIGRIIFHSSNIEATKPMILGLSKWYYVGRGEGPVDDPSLEPVTDYPSGG